MANDVTFYEYNVSEESQSTQNNETNGSPPSITFLITFTLRFIRRQHLYASSSSSEDVDGASRTEDIHYGEVINKQIGVRCDLIPPHRQANSFRSELMRLGVSDASCYESIVGRLCGYLSSVVENHRRSEYPMRTVVHVTVLVNQVTVQGNKRRRGGDGGGVVNQFSCLEISKRRKPEVMEVL